MAAKKSLGKTIRKLRKISLRDLAEAVDIPHSNLKYIEDGVNAPTPEVYGKLIQFLKPDEATRLRMDKLYMAIRNIPPPDVSGIIIAHPSLMVLLREMPEVDLTSEQKSILLAQINSFATQNRKEEPDNG